MKGVLFPNESVLTTRYFDVHQDREVPIPGFFIVEPLRSLRSIDEFTDDEATDFIGVVRAVRSAMREALHIRDVYLFQNEDSDHGFHLWMFPRYDWMEPFGRKIQSVRPIMTHAKEHMLDNASMSAVSNAAARIREYLAH